MNLYKRLPTAVAALVAGFVALALAILAGVGAGVAAIYLYDRGRSKGDDLAVLTIGFFAVAGFVLVLVNSWLLSRHGNISSRVPSIPFGLWLAFATLYCWGSSREFGDYYYRFIIWGWLLTFIALVASWLMSYKLFVVRSD